MLRILRNSLIVILFNFTIIACADNAADVALTPASPQPKTNGFDTKPTSEFPQGCGQGGYSYSGQTIAFTSDGSTKQRIYLIKNTANYIVVLNNVSQNNGMDAGWATRLDPGHWSALAMNRNQFTLSCMARREVPPSLSYVSCSEAVKVCAITPSMQNNSQNGSFWIAENQDLNSVMRAITSKGFQ